jgi:thioredoxin 1
MDALPFLIAGAIALFLIGQFLPLLHARRQRGRPAPPLDGLPSGLRAQDPLLLYFQSAACGMCRGMTPMLESLAREHPGVGVLDVAEHAPLARALGVAGTPALVLIRAGCIEQVLLGARSEGQVRALLANR